LWTRQSGIFGYNIRGGIQKIRKMGIVRKGIAYNKA